MKIALCGPPQSGKSVLRERLKQSLLTLAPNIHPYMLNTNPDGEGAWFQKTFERDALNARQLKTAIKQKWTPAHADLYASWVRNATTPLTFIDLGGIPDQLSRTICAAATHAILLARTEDALLPWREFSVQCNLTILAELLSAYDAPEDQLFSPPTPTFRAAIHHLERGDLHSPRPAIDALAHFILQRLPNPS
jgi:CRISPR-associated protein Csx3